MKNYKLLTFIFAVAVLGSSCSQTTINHNGMDHSTMNHNSANANLPMNHSEMKSDSNAASAPYDLQFIDTMSHHHEGAVEMAEIVVKKSSNEDLKKFAQKIIDDQQKEIAQMKDWREKWFAGAPPAKNMEMTGMADSMKMMTGDEMKKMETLTGTQLDLMFVEMMIPHHQGAVIMANEALQKSSKPEIKTLAGSIIKAQEAEIKQMTDWKAKWKK